MSRYQMSEFSRGVNVGNFITSEGIWRSWSGKERRSLQVRTERLRSINEHEDAIKRQYHLPSALLLPGNKGKDGFRSTYLRDTR